MNVQAMRKSLPAPEPHLTPQDLVDRAASMRTLLRESQDETDRKSVV